MAYKSNLDKIPSVESSHRLSFIEGLLRNWNFKRLVLWVDQHPHRLSTREELLVCFARERLKDTDAWQKSLVRLRQRVFHDEGEHLCYRALSLQTLKDLKRVASDLKQATCFPRDLLLQVAWVRVADKLAAGHQLEEAWELYTRVSGDGRPSEWQRLTELKATIVSYLNGKLDHDAVVALLRSASAHWASTPLTQAYGLAFHLYIASISARWFDQLRMQVQLRLALEAITGCEDQPQLMATSAYLLNPEQGLGAALWRSQLPDPSTPEETAFEHVPEMLWFAYCIEGLENIHRAAHEQSLPDLKQALLYQERQSNGLLAACARSRLLGHMLHHYPLLREPDVAELWFQELRLLQTMPYNELQSFGALLHAAFQYRQGEFFECIQTLRRARRLSQDRLRRRIISLWLAHARGRMPRHVNPELAAVSTHLLNYFFSPSIKSLGNSMYLVSSIYRVDLSLYPVLNRLLQQILRHPQKTLPTQDVQDLVWRQTASLEGWKQKLRNAVSRLRFQFRFVMAPLVCQSQGTLRLNLDAVHFEQAPANMQNERMQDVLRVLEPGPCRLESLRELTRIPGSTLRRYLQELKDRGLVLVNGKGSTALYSLL